MLLREGLHSLQLENEHIGAHSLLLKGFKISLGWEKIHKMKDLGIAIKADWRG